MDSETEQRSMRQFDVFLGQRGALGIFTVVKDGGAVNVRKEAKGNGSSHVKNSHDLVMCLGPTKKSN